MFLHLSRWTIPHGYERGHYADLLGAEGFKEDEHGNWFLNIHGQDGSYPTTAFMVHLDTVGIIPEPITLVAKGDAVGTDGKTILGADDRAGLTVILYMVRHQVPGRYCLFVGEEQGCVGSRLAACDPSLWEGVQHAISFDRKGTSSVITHQCGARTASEEFALALCAAGREQGLAWKPDPTGVFTDSEVFAELIPECTNISVGYYNQHTKHEIQDLAYLEELCEACVSIDWSSLPAVREPGKEADGWWLEYDETGRWSTRDLMDEPEDRIEPRSNYWSSDASMSAWDRVELALELGQAPDGDDLKWIVEDDADTAARLIGSYLKTERGWK
jgi:hypothetical protein